MPNIFTFSVSSGFVVQPTISSAYVSPIPLSVSAGLGIQPAVTLTALRVYRLTVSAGLGLQPTATEQAVRLYRLSVSTGLGLQPTLVATAQHVYRLTVSAGLGLQPTLPTVVANRVYLISLSTGLGLQPAAAVQALRVYRLAVSAGINLQAAVTPNIAKALTVMVGLGLRPTATSLANRVLSVTTGFALQATALAPRTIVLSVSSGLGLQPVPAGIGPLYGSVATTLTLTVSVAAILGGLELSANFELSTSVSCVVEVAAGVGTPGISTTGGPSIPLLSGLSGTFPLTFAETPSGIVIMANGVDPMLRWDAMSGMADYAGIQPPTTAPVLAASGLGGLTGLRYAFARFIDQFGNPSTLSPLGVPVQCGRDGQIDGISQEPGVGRAMITSRGHGLTTGSQVILQNTGIGLDGPWTVLNYLADVFILSGSSISPGLLYSGGGSWLQGAASLAYSALPQPSQSRVSQLQLLRNLEGSLSVLYVDATVPVGTSAYTSTLSDEQLALQESVVLRTEDGTPLALRYALPPSNRPYVVNYMGRVFAAGDAVIYAGCVGVTCGSTTIQGIGTQWTSTLAGRSIYVRGASRSYGILSVNSSLQTLTIDRSYTDSSSPFQTYLIRSAPPERKMLQWSEPDNPEAWPPWNALGLPEDNDEIVGLFVRGTFLFIVERRHLWRYQFSDDPGRSAHVFLQAERGAINQRVIAIVDEGAFLLDESGVYKFDGSNIEPVSQEVQVVFHPDGLAPTFQIDWAADSTLWHASVDPVRTIIRWFVAVEGIAGLQMALCYNYRLARWWWERYPVQVTSSVTGTLAEVPNVGIAGGSRRALAGSECRVVLVLGEGSLDLVGGSGTVRGGVGSATSVTLTDPNAGFAAALGGAPVAIVSGTGMGQVRIISTVSGGTLTVVKPWDTIPDQTSVYQVGGIPWEWRSGWFDLELDEEDIATDLSLAYQAPTNPVQVMARLYYDHSETPDAPPLSTEFNGVVTTAGMPDISFELSDTSVLPGYRISRQAQHGGAYGYQARFVQIFLSGTTNTEVVRIYQVSLRGVDQEGV